MRKSRLSRHKQNKLIEHFVAGTTARTAAVLVGVNKSTASYYFYRLRELIFKLLKTLLLSLERSKWILVADARGNEAEALPVKFLYLAF